ncbi:hypothetical protein M5689_015094 [Euphorbia peplus]|nr:hypothetical protein M5689_015094 [Euphorbia peplus]
MAMEVAVPLDFNFDSNCSSPYITAPSTPQRFGNLYRDSHLDSYPSNSAFSLVTSRSRNATNSSQDFDFLDDDHDFEFDFSGQLDRASLSADELFDGGKIRPLRPPPEYYSSTVSSPGRSPRSRNPSKKDSSEPRTRKSTNQEQEQDQERPRGRERNASGSSKSPNYIHKGSRSLSPFRVSDLIHDEEFDNSNDDHGGSGKISNTKPSYASTFLSAISFSSKGYKKWKLKDLLLFRSASEGRAIGKDQLNKYTVLSKRSEVLAEDVKNSSFRSTDSSVGSSSRRRGRVSAHELHYTANRAVAEEMKRKTVLPYKHGLLGCLGFNHDISRGIGSLTRG